MNSVERNGHYQRPLCYGSLKGAELALWICSLQPRANTGTIHHSI